MKSGQDENASKNTYESKGCRLAVALTSVGDDAVLPPATSQSNLGTHC